MKHFFRAAMQAFIGLGVFVGSVLMNSKKIGRLFTDG